MEKQVHYDNLADRQIKVAKAENEAKGLRMLYDNFDPDWKPGTEPHGTMTFTDIMPPEPPPPIDWKAKFAAADTVAKKLQVLAERLDLV